MNTVPQPVRLAAGIVFGLAVLIGVVVGSVRPHHMGPIGVLGGPFFGLVLGGFLAVWLLCLGYVYADAQRRAMPPVLWVLVAVLVPNLLGFLLYFAVRRPIASPCPRCGRAVSPDHRFCSWCGYEMVSFPPAVPPSPPARPNMGPSSAV
jgi:Phospholipase_D-nuclease N-terminal/zinc-ribbon domain